jgi:hypothetical protein
MTPQTITIIIPDHTTKKLDELQSYYLLPVDMLLQRLVVDRVDDAYELVILEPKRKAAV